MAFQPSLFFGRFLGEIAYSLNDALRRLEGNTSYYVMSGDGDTLQSYYQGLEGSLAEVGRDLDGIIAWCWRKVGVATWRARFRNGREPLRMAVQPPCQKHLWILVTITLALEFPKRESAMPTPLGKASPTVRFLVERQQLHGIVYHEIINAHVGMPCRIS